MKNLDLKVHKRPLRLFLLTALFFCRELRRRVTGTSKRAMCSVLMTLLLLPGPLPKGLGSAGYRLVAVQKESRKAPRVYTNDDPPFFRPPPEAPPKPSTAEEAEQTLAGFLATPMEVVEKMLEMAQVTERDVVYDLGSGDGRIVILAAQKYGARAFGVELDHRLVEESQQKVRSAKLDGLVTIFHGDALNTSLKDATVVAIYLPPDAHEKLRPVLEKELKPGVRVVSHDVPIPGWREARKESVKVGDQTHAVYLYQAPEAFQKP